MPTVQTLVDYLNRAEAIGKDKAILRSCLAANLCITPRELRELCEQARNEGVIVCHSTDSTKGGIYLPKDRNEKWAYMRKLKREALARLKEYNRVKRALKNETEEPAWPGDHHNLELF